MARTDRRTRTTRALGGCAQAAAVALLAAGCGGSGGPVATGSSAPAAASVVLVVLGDSDATGAGDPSGKGWVGYYADRLEAATHRHVDVRSHALEGQTSQTLLGTLSDAGEVVPDLRAADVVVIGAGGGDLNLADDAVRAGTCEPARCYTDAAATFGRNLDGVGARIAAVRAGKPVVLRAVTMPNFAPGAEDAAPGDLLDVNRQTALLQATSMRDATCAAVRAHGGECIDVLTAINGPDGRSDGYATGLLNHDDCCYPSAKGQQLMADLLFRLGVEPTVLR